MKAGVSADGLPALDASQIGNAQIIYNVAADLQLPLVLPSSPSRRPCRSHGCGTSPAVLLIRWAYSSNGRPRAGAARPTS